MTEPLNYATDVHAFERGASSDDGVGRMLGKAVRYGVERGTVEPLRCW